MTRILAGLVVATLVVATTTVFASPLPQAAWLDAGVDLDIAGNEALKLGSVQNCRSVAVGDSFPVDVWVASVPEQTADNPEGGIAGTSYNLHFDPAVINVAEVNNDFMIVARTGAIPYPVIDADATNGVEPDPLPAKTGNMRVDFADINAEAREGGDGVLTRLTVKAVGAGSSTLILRDDLFESYPSPTLHSGPPAGDPFFVNAVYNGIVVVGAPCESVEAPPPVDVGGLGGTLPGGITPPPNPAPGIGDAPRIGVASTGGDSGGGGGGSENGDGSETGDGDGGDGGSGDGDGGGSSAQGKTTVAIDVVPTDNEATLIGEVETCATADAGDRFIVDMIITDVEDLLAFEATVQFEGTVLDLVDRDVKLFLESSDGSQVVDTSGQTPNDDGRYTTGGFDSADPLSPETGSGVLARLTFEAKAEGASPISLDPIDENDDGKADRGVFLNDVDAEPIGDGNDDTFFDGPVAGGEIVVGEPCEDSDARVVTASGGSASDGDDDDGSGVLPFVIGGAVLFGLIALAGAGYLAYQRRKGGAPSAPPPPDDTPAGPAN